LPRQFPSVTDRSSLKIAEAAIKLNA